MLPPPDQQGCVCHKILVFILPLVKRSVASNGYEVLNCIYQYPPWTLDWLKTPPWIARMLQLSALGMFCKNWHYRTIHDSSVGEWGVNAEIFSCLKSAACVWVKGDYFEGRSLLMQSSSLANLMFVLQMPKYALIRQSQKCHWQCSSGSFVVQVVGLASALDEMWYRPDQW